MNNFFHNEMQKHLKQTVLRQISCPEMFDLLAFDRKHDLKTNNVYYFLEEQWEDHTFEHLAFSPDGTYILVCNGQIINKICMTSGKITIFAGIYINGDVNLRNGPKEQAIFCSPHHIPFSPNGKFILICDWKNVRKICLESGMVSTLFPFPFITSLTFSMDGLDIFFTTHHTIGRFCLKTNKKIVIYNCAPLENITNITMSPGGNFCLVTDSSCCNIIKFCCTKLYKMTPFVGMCNHSGFKNGFRSESIFDNPTQTIFSPDGSYILICDNYNCCIRKMCVKSGQVTTFAGIPKEEGNRLGVKEQALFESPTNITFSPCGQYIIICDINNIKYIRI
jgi:WD40 repeat protein